MGHQHDCVAHKIDPRSGLDQFVLFKRVHPVHRSGNEHICRRARQDLPGQHRTAGIGNHSAIAGLRVPCGHNLVQRVLHAGRSKYGDLFRRRHDRHGQRGGKRNNGGKHKPADHCDH